MMAIHQGDENAEQQESGLDPRQATESGESVIEKNSFFIKKDLIRKSNATIKKNLFVKPSVQQLDSEPSSIDDVSFHPRSFSPRHIESKTFLNFDTNDRQITNTPISLQVTQQRDKKAKPIHNEKFRINRNIGIGKTVKFEHTRPWDPSNVIDHRSKDKQN